MNLMILLVGLLMMAGALAVGVDMTPRDPFLARLGPAFGMLTGWLLVAAEIARPDLLPVAAGCLLVSVVWLGFVRLRHRELVKQVVK